MATPPTQAGLKMVYSFNWRGTTKQWSQLWHWTEGNWASQGQFDTFATLLFNNLKTFTNPRVTFVEAVAYNPGSFLPVFTHVIGSPGTYAEGTPPEATGEACMLWKFTTDQRTTKNHPIYLFKWFHGVQADGATDPDTLRNGTRTSAESVLTTILAGLSDGTNTRHYCGPRGAVAQTGSVNTKLHMREFPT